MIYRNVKTGVLIDVASKISGGNWEEVIKQPLPIPPTEPKPAPVKKETTKQTKKTASKKPASKNKKGAKK